MGLVERSGIDNELELILDVEDLPYLEEEWAEISDDDRGAAYHEGANNAATLEELEEAYRASRMTPVQQLHGGRNVSVPGVAEDRSCR